MSKLPITTKEVPLGPALVTPGEILLEEFLIPRGISRTALAKKMGVDPMRISEIVRGKRAITAETALLLSSVLGTSPRFWLGIQNDHDLAVAASKTRGSLAASATLVLKAQKSSRDLAASAIAKLSPEADRAIGSYSRRPRKKSAA